MSESMVHVHMTAGENVLAWITSDGRVGHDPIPGAGMLLPTVTLVLHGLGLMGEGGMKCMVELHVAGRGVWLLHPESTARAAIE